MGEERLKEKTGEGEEGRKKQEEQWKKGKGKR